jgi:hypothetical protein
MAAPVPGRYSVSVYAAGHAAVQREVDVTAAEPEVLEIVVGRETC